MSSEKRVLSDDEQRRLFFILLRARASQESVPHLTRRDVRPRMRARP